MAEASKDNHGETIPFFPDHVTTEAYVVLGILVLGGIVGVLGLINPVGTGDPADPMNTPAHVKPEWYFLALYQLLKFVPETVGVLLPILGLAILMVWPFIDRKTDTHTARRIRALGVAVFLVVAVALTIWGEMS